MAIGQRDRLTPAGGVLRVADRTMLHDRETIGFRPQFVRLDRHRDAL
jgi:hypothetical protein